MMHSVPRSPDGLTLRSPEHVMQLSRIGSFHPTRISFVRTLTRRMGKEDWSFDHQVFDLDDQGYGTIVYKITTPDTVISLVAFSNRLEASDRTDRVIAERWDSAFVLVNGEVDTDDISRLRDNAPLQEAGRFKASDIVLSRANKSIRLFQYMSEQLSQGNQPKLSEVLKVGYLMRTTAVYGNGKLGMGDLAQVFTNSIFKLPYQAEMLMVYMVREFSFDLVNHIAAQKSPEQAVPLSSDVKRALGVGNATGLGMAPFLLGHPTLFNSWILARETALARVRNVEYADEKAQAKFLAFMPHLNIFADQWNTDDEPQMVNIETLRGELSALGERYKAEASMLSEAYPWDALINWCEVNGSIELQEMMVSTVIELYPELVETLEEIMGSDERTTCDPASSLFELKQLIEDKYGWALDADYKDPFAQHYFWYRSEEKEEPRLGERFSEPGMELETPIGVARDVKALHDHLSALGDGLLKEEQVAVFLIKEPQWRHTVTRAQSLADYPYAEIRGNMLAADCRPIDLLRCKLSVFGAGKYDPKSDRWTRVNFFQGAPLPHELGDPDAQEWAFPIFDLSKAEG